MQRFPMPALALQLAGEPIEQLGMGGPLAVVAEIARRPHDAAAEMIMPKAIGQHARRERIFGIDDPTGQSLAPLSLRGVGGERIAGSDAGQRA